MGDFGNFLKRAEIIIKISGVKLLKKNVLKKTQLLMAFPINHIILVLGEWLGVAYITLVATHSFHYYWTVL